MKARKVSKLDARAPLADMAERIVRVRLEELYSFVPQALDPAEQQTQHDMRIAAKRLRYVLEVTAPCFGSYAGTAAKRARQLQDALGEVHDCDVLLPEVQLHIARLRAHDAAALRARAGATGDLDPALAASAPNRAAYRGLEVLCVHLEARRKLLFERFVERWASLQRAGLRRRLEGALEERPEQPERSRLAVAAR